MKPEKQCPFCEIVNSNTHSRIVAENDLVFLIRDAYPVTDGHSLIIPKRHISSFFETTEPEKLALLQLLELGKTSLDSEFKPAGFNIGINDGLAAGQTVPHMHIHLIPRYEEQGIDPRGGVRWVIREKADYWSER